MTLYLFTLCTLLSHMFLSISTSFFLIGVIPSDENTILIKRIKGANFADFSQYNFKFCLLLTRKKFEDECFARRIDVFLRRNKFDPCDLCETNCRLHEILEEKKCALS